MQFIRWARDWIIGLSGTILIVVGVTARSVPEVERYGYFGITLGVLALVAWVIAFGLTQVPDVKNALNREDQINTCAAIKASQEQFRHDVMVAAAAGEEPAKTVIALVNAEFERLAALAAKDAACDCDELNDQAQELFAYRALFSSESALDVMTYEAFTELTEWGVPIAIRTDYEAKITLAKSANPANVPAWREWVMMLLRQHAVWDSYVSWFNGFLGRVTFLLVLILSACLIEGVLQLVIGMTVLGLLFFGTAGAIVSILFSLPRVSSYEEVNAWIFHIVSRVVTGVAGSYIGWGLLTSKAVSFGLGGTEVSDLLKGCATACDAPHLLIVGAVAMLMGFSERLLPDLEARFFNSTAKTPLPTSTVTPPTSLKGRAGNDPSGPVTPVIDGALQAAVQKAADQKPADK